MRKKKNLDSRMEACDRLWIRRPEEYRGRWRELMPDAVRLRLELGCGKGRFTAETAAAHREDLYVAVERVPDAMVIAMERCRALGLTNVFFIDGDAAALSEYFAPGEVDMLYINFCDPWPSVKHSRRRLTHEGFLRGYRQVMGEGGEIHFKTDNRDLFEWSLFQFPKAGYTLSEVTRDLHANGVQGVMTDYEEKFHSLGTPINRCVGTMGPLPDVPVAEGLSALLPRWEIRRVEEGDLAAVLSLLEGDSACVTPTGERPTMDSLRLDLTALPPRCQQSQKDYLALWREGRVEGVLDLVRGYPRANTLFVGLLLIDPALRRKGMGREIVSALSAAAAGAGLERVRLACLTDDRESRDFWEAMGFTVLREDMAAGGERPVWIMERLAERIL